MEQSTCPICCLIFPLQDIQRHVDYHFADEEFSRDLELAKLISVESASSSSRVATSIGTGRADGIDVKMASLVERESATSSSRMATSIGTGRDEGIDVKMASLASMQIKEVFFRVERGLMASLQNCLASEAEKDSTTSILCGYLDHFHSRESEDKGWGCGWRNIQMLSSHLIKQRPEARGVLFGGAGFVPDIASLQRWLEIAWELGFDTQGSNDFNGEIYGRRNWIGTTECAALLRSFGLHAMVVDFCGEEADLVKQNSGKRKVAQVYGPMDKLLLKYGQKETHQGLGKHSISQKGKGPEVLVDWVWNYFSDNNTVKLGSKRVVLTEKAPLYFQQDGHSRTIVGIQAILKSNGIHQYNLLILDPAHQTEALQKSMQQKFGWQKLVKRGIHTLKKSQYQLCFIEHGIASGEEIEQLKIVRGIRYEI